MAKSTFGRVSTMAPSTMPSPSTIFFSIAALLGSLVLTNVIVLWMKKKQFERVQVKSSQLGRGATAPAVKVTVVTGETSLPSCLAPCLPASLPASLPAQPARLTRE